MPSTDRRIQQLALVSGKAAERGVRLGLTTASHGVGLTLAVASSVFTSPRALRGAHEVAEAMRRSTPLASRLAGRATATTVLINGRLAHGVLRRLGGSARKLRLARSVSRVASR